MIELRPYQKDLSAKAVDLLRSVKIVYLTMEVRTGKTLTALNTANDYGAKKVLFLTKLKAIKSIQDDYNALQPNYAIQIINNESLHKVVDTDFDLIISDEHHRNSAFPKPNKTAKLIKERYGNLPMIFLSGTPTAESGSQWFHSFWVSDNSPFKYYRNFYQWAKDFTKPKTRYLGSIQIPDYSDSIDEKILPIIEPYLLKYTQSEAGFESEVKENIIYCPMTERTNNMVKLLLKDKIIAGLKETVLGDTPAKLMSKVHQLSNGTCIFESGNSMVIDTTKAEFIKNHFTGKKIALF
jgi:superfamily II DNA or RNA helicase